MPSTQMRRGYGMFVRRYQCHMDHGHMHGADGDASHAGGGGCGSKDRTYLAYLYDHIGEHMADVQEIAERLDDSMGADVAQELSTCTALLADAQECLHRTIHLMEGRE